MKLKGIYYLSEPKDIECDYIDIRILTDPENNENGGYEYTMQVVTPKYIIKVMKENKFFYSNLPIIIVEHLEDDIIINIIKTILPNIDKIAQRIE